MEHLLAPANSTPINIPYLGIEEFEADPQSRVGVLDNFKEYMIRRGWKIHPQTRELNFENRTPEEISQDLQTWLYFGCLISVFRRVTIMVRTSDFLDRSLSPGQETFVRTTRLHSLIAEWGRREGFANGPVRQDFNDQKYIRGENIKETLFFTFWFLPMFCRQSDAMADPYRGRMKLVELSIMAMAESLCSALAAIYGYDIQTMPTWGPSPVLKARLRDNGWCVSDSPFFPESMTRAAISVDYYFGGLLCPRSHKDHSTCNAAICSEYLEIIEPKKYKQKHATSDCTCERVPVPSEAINLVAQEQIPVIRWDGNKIYVSIGDLQTKYVAISHVWSDGLGTDYEANSLPRCQLSRIQSLVNKLYTAEAYSPSSDLERTASETPCPDRMVPFWIDSLCVPVGKENETLRTQAIRQMAETYSRADRVLVLDSFILKLSRSAGIIHKFLGIHLSKWHHRLWTMQEGQLAQSLYFQFKDGAESFHDMRHATLQSLDDRAPQHLCSPVQLLCATELETFYRFSDTVYSDDITIRMQSCAKYLRSRQTSRLEDEAICVANILGLDADRVLDHKGQIKRMACFYDLVGRFDPRIIFHELPRLPRKGYRWAPRSFLRQLPNLISGFMDDHTSPSWLNPGGGGLPVRFPGFEFQGNTLPQPGSSIFLRGSNFWGQQQSSWAQRTAWWACTYKLQVTEMLQDDDDADDAVVMAAFHSGWRYAVILPSYLCPDHTPTTGVVGIVGPNIPQHPMMFAETPWMVWTTNERPASQRPCYLAPNVITIRYIGRVLVSLPVQGTVPHNISFPTAMAYGAGQEWCIR